MLHTQIAVRDLNSVSSAAQAPLGRSGIELQLLSIIVPTTALQRGQDRKCILHPVWTSEKCSSPGCLQSGWLAVRHCSHFVNEPTVNCHLHLVEIISLVCCFFQEVTYNVVYLKSSTSVTCVEKLLLALMVPET